MAYNNTNAPTQIDINTFRSQLDTYGSVAKGCRFAVKISAAGNKLSNLLSTEKSRDLIFVCDAAEFPGRGFNVTDMRYYGPSQAFPNNVLYGPANFSFICRTQSMERKLFDDWMDLINPTTTFNFEYPSEYYSKIEIFQYAEYGTGDVTYSPGNNGNVKSSGSQNVKSQAVYGWTLHKAWPTLVNAQAVTWNEPDILRLQVTFNYKYWDRSGLS